LKLTIAIPTYNRNAILCRNLALLLPQLTADCELVIIDNCSRIPVAHTLRGLLEDYPSVTTRLIRNKVNIGCVANVLRCFELCESEWLWVLGDDDIPEVDCIETITSCLSTGVALITFSEKRLGVLSNADGVGLASFIEKVGLILPSFISTNVYNAVQLVPSLSFGYHFCTSDFPHLVLTINALLQDGSNKWQSCGKAIVKAGQTADSGWNPILVATGLPLIVNSVESEAARRIVAKGVTELCTRVLKPHSLIAQLSVSEWTEKGLISLSALRQYKAILYGLLQYEGFSVLYLKWLFLSIFALTPRATKWLCEKRWQLSNTGDYPRSERGRL